MGIYYYVIYPESAVAVILWVGFLGYMYEERKQRRAYLARKEAREIECDARLTEKLNKAADQIK